MSRKYAKRRCRSRRKPAKDLDGQLRGLDTALRARLCGTRAAVKPPECPARPVGGGGTAHEPPGE